MLPGTSNERPVEDDEWALEWAPTSTTDGRGYAQRDMETELGRHLPDEWSVVEYDHWGPSRVTHGGGGGYDARVEHPAGSAVEIEPDTTWRKDADRRTVFNSHRVEVVKADGSREVVADARSVKDRAPDNHPARVFAVVVEVVESVDVPPVQVALGSFNSP